MAASAETRWDRNYGLAGSYLPRLRAMMANEAVGLVGEIRQLESDLQQLRDRAASSHFDDDVVIDLAERPVAAGAQPARAKSG
jgi:hypothetical protein